jgi:hypothetical protein
MRFPLLVVLAVLAALAGCADEDTKLKVTDLTPVQGDAQGGTYVVIKGNRFNKDGPRNAKVYFGGQPGSIVRFQSDSELIVQAPPGKGGDVVDVLVIFDPGGQLTIKKAFRYQERGAEMPTVKDLDTSGKPKK